MRSLAGRSQSLQWSTSFGYVCPEITFTLLRDGWSCDAEQVEQYEVLTTAKRILDWKPSLTDSAQQLFDLWEIPTYRPQFGNGPLHRLREVLHQIGATVDRNFTVSHPRVPRFNLLYQAKAYVQQAAREMVAYAQWKQLSTRSAPLATAKNTRQDMKGIPRHLDTVTTTWLLRHRGIKGDPLLGNFLSEMLIRDLELVLSGALWTYSRRAHSQIPDPQGKMVTTGWCRHCNDPEEIEDTYHIF